VVAVPVMRVGRWLGVVESGSLKFGSYLGARLMMST